MLTAKPAIFSSRYPVAGGLLRLVGSPALRDAGILGVGALISQVIVFFAALVILRLYTPADFGLYSFAYGAIALVATLGTWKIERLIIVVPSRATATRLLVSLVVIAAGTTVLLLALAVLARALVGTLPFASGKGSELLWAVPPGMFILVAATGFRFYSIRLGKFTSVAVGQISRAVVFAAGTVATGLCCSGAEHGASIILAWQVVADACALFVQIGANHRTARLILRRPCVRDSLTVVRRYLRTLGPLAFSQVVCAVNEQIPISTVALAFGATYAGWFALAGQFVYVPLTIVTRAVADVANQRFSRRHAARLPFSTLALRITLSLAAAGALPFAFIIFLGPTLLPLVLGPRWLGATQSVSAIAVSSYLFFVTSPTSNIPLIVDARRYIVLWQLLKMLSLAGLGAAALYGRISYPTWLVLMVAASSALYFVDGIAGYVFARCAELRWGQRRAAGS